MVRIEKLGEVKNFLNPRTWNSRFCSIRKYLKTTFLPSPPPLKIEKLGWKLSKVTRRFRSNITDVTVIRSVSDAVEPSSKYSSMRRCNGFLRRPEILETVYSVEEDGDSENNQDPSESTENSECEERRAKNLGNGKGRLQDLYGSFERLAQEADSPPSERPRDESQQAQVRRLFLPEMNGLRSFST